MKSVPEFTPPSPLKKRMEYAVAFEIKRNFPTNHRLQGLPETRRLMRGTLFGFSAHPSGHEVAFGDAEADGARPVSR